MKTLEELRQQLIEIGEKLGGGVHPNGHFIIPDASDGMATPHLEIHDDKYHYVVCERGVELSRTITSSEDEILYWFVESSVSAIASNLAASECPPNGEFRRLYFKKQYELLKLVNPTWAEKKRKYFIDILVSEMKK
ncbi:immunity protein 63 of polymorphic toxin system [Erwinia sp. AG740]|nr:immunity protein 63 of polymorphic toxin system [Erwinia sp. AG740]